MFKELHEIAKRGPLALMIVAEDDQLRVTVTQKKAAGARPVNIHVTAAPDELDAELPAAIAQASTITATKPIKDQVAEQVEKQAAAAQEKTEKKAVKKERKLTPRQASAIAAGERKRKERAARDAKAKTPKPATKVTLPGAKKKAAKRPASHEQRATSNAVKHQDGRPDKAACIADYHTMKAKHGDKLNRELFIDKGATGRRFERLWGMSWKKFVAAAERKETLIVNGTSPGKTPGATPPIDDDTADLFAAGTEAAVNERTEADVLMEQTDSTAPQQTEAIQETAPERSAVVAADPPATTPPGDPGRIVKLAGGRILASGYVHSDPDGLDVGSTIPLDGVGTFRALEVMGAILVVEPIEQHATTQETTTA